MSSVGDSEGAEVLRYDASRARRLPHLHNHALSCSYARYNISLSLSPPHLSLSLYIYIYIRLYLALLTAKLRHLAKHCILLCVRMDATLI